MRKYFYHIRTSPELEELKFSKPYDEDRLTDFWKILAKTFPEVVGNRTYDTVFRTASEFARLMLKPAIDFEVIEQTTKYLSDMYKQVGKAISETVDKRAIASNAICNVIKEQSSSVLGTTE